MLIPWVALLVQSVVGRSPGGSGGRGAVSVAMQLYELEPCKGAPDNLVISNFTAVRDKNGVNYYNGNILMRKELKDISKLEMTTTQCIDAVSYNTCSYLNTFKFTTGVCGLMTSDAMPWASLMQAVHPSYKCPIAAGKYVVRNGTVNMSTIKKLAGPSLKDALGKIFVPEARLYNEQNQLFSCIKFKATFINPRT
ncbi:hypothetical protein FOCC_FOCC002836 [Frankliniella occidentalis]|nr:hypothetical protein FOCC_FOCC002836 [Frankliniella occidentalis]